jgi:hypothetical protein
MHCDGLVDVSGGEDRSYPRRIGRRADLDDVETDHPAAYGVDDLLHVHRHQPERLGGPGAGRESRIYPVDVYRKIDFLALHAFQSFADGTVYSLVHDLVRADEWYHVVPVQFFLAYGAAPYDERVFDPYVLGGA